MISVVTVILDRLAPFLGIFTESLLEKVSLVSEVIVVNVDQSGIEERWRQDGIDFKLIGGKPPFECNSPISYCGQHAYGLHVGLEHATNEYIMFSDPDVFFYIDTAEFYASMIEKFNLNFIGVCRPASTAHSTRFFPTLINCMVKKSDLPPNDFGKEIIPSYDFPTYFFPMDSVPKEIKNLYPNPDGHYETGTRLYLWAKQQEWRWWAYIAPDCNNYCKSIYRNNFGDKIRFPKEKILYHESLSSGMQHNKIEKFREAYNLS